MTPNIIQQSDRDAAAAMWLASHPKTDDTAICQAGMMADSTADSGPVVQAFASYRLQILEEAAKWQPIATAPKDGRRLIVTGLNWGVGPDRHVELAVWSEPYGGWKQADDEDQSLAYLTHWLPLTSPPESLRTNHRANEGGGDD